MLKKALHRLLCMYITNTSSHPGRGILARLAWRLHPKPIPYQLAPGVTIQIKLNDAEDLGYCSPHYRRNGDLEVFRSLLQPGMTVVDIGANIGIYSLFAAGAIGSSGRVIAFEPVPHIYEALAANLKINEAANVTACNLAMSNLAGTAIFHLGASHSQGSLCRDQTGHAIEVVIETLDGFWGQH